MIRVLALYPNRMFSYPTLFLNPKRHTPYLYCLSCYSFFMMAVNATKLKPTFWAFILLRLVSALFKPQIAHQLFPRQNTTSSCTYITASTLGIAALCSTESIEYKAVLSIADVHSYCNCDGSIAPLRTTTIIPLLTSSDCAWLTQPTGNTCPGVNLLFSLVV